jgi:hypothetical protein
MILIRLLSNPRRNTFNPVAGEVILDQLAAYKDQAEDEFDIPLLHRPPRLGTGSRPLL